MRAKTAVEVAMQQQAARIFFDEAMIALRTRGNEIVELVAPLSETAKQMATTMLDEYSNEYSNNYAMSALICALYAVVRSERS